jgi:hypothetical protein
VAAWMLTTYNASGVTRACESVFCTSAAVICCAFLARLPPSSMCRFLLCVGSVPLWDDACVAVFSRVFHVFLTKGCCGACWKDGGWQLRVTLHAWKIQHFDAAASLDAGTVRSNCKQAFVETCVTCHAWNSWSRKNIAVHFAGVAAAACLSSSLF